MTRNETRMPGFLDGINPNGRVPVLETDDCAFLAEAGTILFTWPTARPSFATNDWGAPGVAVDVLR